MGLFHNCFAMVALVTVFAKSGDAIQCYQCTGQNVSVAEPTGTNCFDPFSSEAAPIECGGKCFANFTASSSGGLNFQQVQRGCITNPAEECLPSAFCQDVSAPEGSETGRYCSYCCGEEMCNSQGLEEAAADSTSCWHCDFNLTESMQVTPGSCPSDDFNGGVPPDVLSVPCTGMCVIANAPAGLFGATAKFLRTCDQFGLCSPGGPPQGFENIDFKCCEGDKCNVGGIDAIEVGGVTTSRTVVTTMEPSGEEGHEGTEGGVEGGEDGDTEDHTEGSEDGDKEGHEGTKGSEDGDGEGGEEGGEGTESDDEGDGDGADKKITIHLATVISGFFASVYFTFYFI